MVAAIEECAELQQALTKCIRTSSQRDIITEENLLEELADTFIMVKQIAVLAGEARVAQKVQEKLARLRVMVRSAREV